MYIVKLMMMSGVNDGLEVELANTHGMGEAVEQGWRFSIGRSEDRDLVIRYDTQVSREHAHLSLKGTDLWLTDAGSRNGCLVDDTRIRRPTRLRSGQLFRVGRTWLRVQDFSQ